MRKTVTAPLLVLATLILSLGCSGEGTPTAGQAQTVPPRKVPPEVSGNPEDTQQKTMKP